MAGGPFRIHPSCEERFVRVDNVKLKPRIESVTRQSPDPTLRQNRGKGLANAELALAIASSGDLCENRFAAPGFP
jgi:hypothetical protein